MDKQTTKFNTDASTLNFTEEIICICHIKHNFMQPKV